VTVRVRMAPSPTGYLHVGNARTFLYNWYFARQQGGVVILRIEDTDAERHMEDAIQVIRDGMTWLGTDWDEEVRQSERSDAHVAAATKLNASGRAYWCACTQDEVKARAEARGGPPGYDGHCRDLGLGPGPGRALRFRTPDEGVTVVHDIVRGDPEFRNDTIDDFVIQRANGSALFLLANVVDDGDMAITHIIRGDDHLSNTPKQLLLWDALGYGAPPVYAHLPMMVNEQRKKLSKRKDPVVVSEYREQGYLPGAMANVLSLVGWGPSDGRERLTLEEMRELFRLEDVSSSPGFWDVKKLRAFNGDLIRELPVEDFVVAVQPFLPAEIDLAVFRAIAPEVQTRVAVLSETWPLVRFAYEEPKPDGVGFKAGAAEVLDGAAEVFSSCEWTASEIESALKGWGDAHEPPLKVQAPVRLAISGESKGLPLGTMLEVLGREKAIARVRAARAQLA
jgi:glutamyl-tRNA synthetase